MPAVIRDLKITYGGFIVGSSTDRLIDGYSHVERGFELASTEFSFIITSSSDSGFSSEIIAVESAFRKPRQDCLIEQGSSTLFSCSQSGNTGFDANPTVVKFEDLADTGRSRRYSVKIEFGQPADNLGTLGRRGATINVAFTPARKRKLTITGTYTATPGPPVKTAYENYNANVETFADTQKLLVDPTIKWELIEEPKVEFFETNKVLDFTRVYQELILSDAGLEPITPPLDDPEIVNQVLRITRERQGIESTVSQIEKQGFDNDANPPVNSPGGVNSGEFPTLTSDTPRPENVSQNVEKPMRLLVTYEAWIDKTLNQAIATKWIEKIKPWIIERVKDTRDGSGNGTVAIINENPEFDRTDNRITATMEFHAVGNSQLLEQTITTEDSDMDFGFVAIPAWTGNRYSRYVYTGFATKRRITSEKRRVLGTSGSGFLGSPTGLSPSTIPISRSVKRTPLKIGVAPNQYDVVDVEVQTTNEFFVPITTRSTPPPTPAGTTTTTPKTDRPDTPTGSLSGAPIVNVPNSF